MTDAESLGRAVEGCTTVVHLVAILLGQPEEFERIMIQGTRDLVEASKAAGVTRLVLQSALGTEEGARSPPTTTRSGRRSRPSSTRGSST